MVHKTTVYLPAELKAALKRAAVQRAASEAEIIRSAIEKEVAPGRPRPRGSLFTADEPIAGRVDELLAGFGEH